MSLIKHLLSFLLFSKFVCFLFTVQCLGRFKVLQVRVILPICVSLMVSTLLGIQCNHLLALLLISYQLQRVFQQIIMLSSTAIFVFNCPLFYSLGFSVKFPNNVFKSNGYYRQSCFLSDYNGNNKPNKLPFTRIVGVCFKIDIYHIRQYLSIF